MRKLALIVLGCLLALSAPAAAQTLNIYNWADYLDDAVIREFEREYGIRVIYNVYSNNEELHARLRGGASGYDVIFPSDYMAEVLIAEGLLQPIPREAVPNLAYIDERFLDLPFDPGNQYTVPYLWGSTGIGVNTRYVKEPVDSWDILWDPKYRGRIAMLNDPREVFGVALKRLGYSANTRDLEALEKAKELLVEQKPLVLTYDSDNTEILLVSEEVWLAHGYSGDVLRAMEDNPDITYVVPKEGGLLWMDVMAIPKTARNVDGALKFINFILRPDIHARLAEANQYPTPNRAAWEYHDEEFRQNPAIYVPDDVMERMEWIEDLGDMATVVDRLWTEVKAD
ncbi:MAG: spermidine/putrescine ABC transporter substrate-binding protein [Firmicutes bacterium]|nr:spermidine/putrescine ABC transporter substrate-binding protein [Bacillota bacterium]MBO2521383.1 spermidine/putrescine ABC transporter substrate-binding protein [Bacillota bacterium]